MRLRSNEAQSQQPPRLDGFSCRRYRLDGFAVVAVAGEIDVHTAPAFRDEMLTAITDESPRLIVDLTEVPFMDSSGLAALVVALRRARDEGGRVRLVGPTSGPRKVLRIVQLDRVLPIHDTLDDARLSATGQADVPAQSARGDGHGEADT
jgi:anti-sigma B factor antagonist